MFLLVQHFDGKREIWSSITKVGAEFANRYRYREKPNVRTNP